MNQNEHRLSATELVDIDWLAFRYIASEMSKDERGEFEARLATDQSAREAVAAAVELTQTIAGSEVLVHSVERASRRQCVGRWQLTTWIATAVAACLAMVVGYQFVSQLVPRGENNGSPYFSHQRSTSMDNPLAQAWIDAADESDELDPFASTLIDIGAEDDDSTDGLEDVSVEAPDWMLAAVNGMAQSSNEEN